MKANILIGFGLGVVISAIARNVPFIASFGGGIEAFIGLSVFFGSLSLVFFFLPTLKRWTLLAVGLALGWSGGAIILWLIGMAIGVPLSILQ